MPGERLNCAGLTTRMAVSARAGVAFHTTLDSQGAISIMFTNNQGACLAAAAALFALSATAFSAPAPAGSSGLAVAASDKVHTKAVAQR